MQAEDITRINDEMQRRPNDSYLEIVGHYVIDRLTAGAGPLQAGKTLAGCMKIMREEAKEVAQYNVGVLTSVEIYEIIDQYFCFPTDVAAQQKSAQSACAGMRVGLDTGTGASFTPPTPVRPTHKPIVDLYDFM